MDQSYKRLLLIVLALGAGCSRPSPSAEGGQGVAEGTRIVGRYDGGVVTEAELAAESSKLPSPLHEQFESEVGQREFVRSMIDRRLLELEARRRGLHEDAAILKQVRELESRLIIQALLAAEEQRVGAPSEQTLREYYQEQRQTLAQPERVRVARVFVAVPQTVIHQDKPVLDVELRADNGQVETVGVTGEHLFGVMSHGWMNARDLASTTGVNSLRIRVLIPLGLEG